MLLPKILDFFEELIKDPNLGGYRINIIWTLTSAIHLILVSSIQDNIEPIPENVELMRAQIIMKKLEQNLRVLNDRPDNPMKGLRGPIKHALFWIDRGLFKNKYYPTIPLHTNRATAAGERKRCVR